MPFQVEMQIKELHLWKYHSHLWCLYIPETQAKTKQKPALSLTRRAGVC